LRDVFLDGKNVFSGGSDMSATAPKFTSVLVVRCLSDNRRYALNLGPQVVGARPDILNPQVLDHQTMRPGGPD
jgi:hypothetical protein